MKVIEISDFSGGKNSYFDQLLIADNECASASDSVWAPNKALTKMPGTTLFLSSTAAVTNGQLAISIAEDTVNSAYDMYAWMSAALGGKIFLWGIDSTSTGSFLRLGYTIGSFSVSGANLISATGNGTSWVSANVTANDVFYISAADAPNIASVEDETHLTLSTQTTQAWATGTTYSIHMPMTILPIHVAYAVFNGTLCACTTGDNLQRYTGSSNYRITTAPKAAFLAAHKNYLFSARTNSNESRLSWSAIKDETTWPANNFIDIDVKRGKITGLISYGNELIVFKTKGLFAIVGDIFDPANPTYVVRPIAVPQHFLFNSPLAMCIHKGILYFYSNGVIWRYIGGTNYITPVSTKFQYDFPLTGFQPLTDVTSTTTQPAMVSFGDYIAIKGFLPANSQAVQQPIALIDDNMKWWMMLGTPIRGGFDIGNFIILNSSTARPQLLIYNKNYGAWNSFNYMYGPTYATSLASRNLSSPWNTTAAVTGTWASKEFNVEYAAFKEIVVYLKKQSTGTLTLKYSIDQGTSTSVSIDMTVGRGNMIRSVIPINQKGSTIQVTFNHGVISETFLVYGFKIFYEPIFEDRKA